MQDLYIETQTSVYRVRLAIFSGKGTVQVLKTEVKEGEKSSIPAGAVEYGDRFEFIPQPNEYPSLRLWSEERLMLVTTPIIKWWVR